MDLLYFLLAVFFSLALGRRLLNLLRIHERHFSQQLFLSFGSGWLILAILTTVLGFSHAIYRWLFVCVTLGGLAVFWREAWQIAALLVRSLRGLFRTPFLAILVALVAIPLLIDFLASLAPPTFTDVVLYHLEMPRQYLRAHKVSYIQSIIYTSYPQYIEMIFLFGYALKGEIVSQLLSWSFTPFFALGVYAMVRKRARQEFAGLAALAFVSMTPVAKYAGTAYVDIQTAFFAFVSVYALLRFLETYERGSLLLSALAGGLSLGARMSSVFFICVIALILFVALRREAGRFRLTVIYLGISALVAMPWYLSAYLNTGNPVFPYFYKFLGGRNWNELSDSVMSFFVARPHYSGVTSAGELILFLWDLFGGAHRVSLALLAFLPLVPLALRVDREIRIILIVSFSCLVLLSFFVVQARFHLVSFALLLVLSFLAAASLSRMGRFTRYLCYLIIVLSLARGLEIHWGCNFDALHSVVTGEKRENYIRRNFPDYDAMQWMNRNLPAGSKVLIWAFSGYYLDHDYVWMGPLRQGLIDFTKVKNAEMLAERMRELGVTHVYYRPGHKEVVIPRALGVFVDMDSLQVELERKFLTPLANFGDARVFGVNYSGVNPASVSSRGVGSAATSHPGRGLSAPGKPAEVAHHATTLGFHNAPAVRAREWLSQGAFLGSR
jgi:hypothetical protein